MRRGPCACPRRGRGRVGLRIEVTQQHPRAGRGQRRRQVYGSGRFSHAALLIDDRDDLRQAATSFGCRYGAILAHAGEDCNRAGAFCKKFLFHVKHLENGPPFCVLPHLVRRFSWVRRHCEVSAPRFPCFIRVCLILIDASIIIVYSHALGRKACVSRETQNLRLCSFFAVEKRSFAAAHQKIRQRLQFRPQRAMIRRC